MKIEFGREKSSFTIIMPLSIFIIWLRRARIRLNYWLLKFSSWSWTSLRIMFQLILMSLTVLRLLPINQFLLDARTTSLLWEPWIFLLSWFRMEKSPTIQLKFRIHPAISTEGLWSIPLELSCPSLRSMGYWRECKRPLWMCSIGTWLTLRVSPSSYSHIPKSRTTEPTALLRSIQSLRSHNSSVMPRKEVSSSSQKSIPQDMPDLGHLHQISRSWIRATDIPLKTGRNIALSHPADNLTQLSIKPTR